MDKATSSNHDDSSHTSKLNKENQEPEGLIAHMPMVVEKSPNDEESVRSLRRRNNTALKQYRVVRLVRILVGRKPVRPITRTVRHIDSFSLCMMHPVWKFAYANVCCCHWCWFTGGGQDQPYRRDPEKEKGNASLGQCFRGRIGAKSPHGQGSTSSVEKGSIGSSIRCR